MKLVDNRGMLKRVLLQQISYAEYKAYKGFDPYDVRDSWLWGKILHLERKNKFVGKVFSNIFRVIEHLFPFGLRRFLHVSPSLNYKSLGLFIMTYINIYKMGLISKETLWLKSKDILSILLSDNHAQQGLGWGYPFTWYSYKTIPCCTPSAIVTVTIGESILRLYELLGYDQLLDIAVHISEFMLSDLNRFYDEDGDICFSYTPIDDYQVHNVNLLLSAYLAELGRLINDNYLVDIAARAARFSIKQQNKDGSIFYWSRQQNYRNPNHLDLYHSGFEIRALYRLSKMFPWIKSSLEQYIEFYITSFWKKGHVWFSPKSRYPVDVHALSEAVNCISSIDEGWRYKNYADIALMDLFDALFSPVKGNFMWRVIKVGPILYRSDIEFMRWGTAWVSKAISEYLVRYYSNINSEEAIS